MSKYANQVVKTNVFPMGDILTSGDPVEGHNHKPVRNVIHLGTTIKNTSQMSGAQHTGQNVPHFKYFKVRFQMVAVTLRLKQKSNMGMS